MLRVLLDTTVLCDDYMLDRPDSRRLLEAARNTLCTVHFSPVVIAEAHRRHSEDLKDARRSLVARLEVLEEGKFGLHSGFVHQLKEICDTRERDYPQLLQRIIDGAGMELEPWPTTAHEQLVNRDLGRHKPFREIKDQGTVGYRDALIWMGVVNLAQRYPDDPVILVSNNLRDFGAGQGASELHPSLTKHAESLGCRPGQIGLAKDLADLILHHLTPLFEEDEAKIGAAITEALHAFNEKLIQMSWEPIYNPREGDYDSPEIEADLPSGMNEVTVTSIEGPYDVEIEETHEQTSAATRDFRCRRIVTAELEGFVEKSAFYLDRADDLFVWDSDVNDYVLGVGIERSLRLTTHVSYDPNSQSVTTVDLLSSEVVPARHG
jgi:hypothetical protein